MTAVRVVEELPTREECIAEAGAIYGRILADPERAEQLLKHREEQAARAAAAEGAK